jgi:hypothetical protein
VTVGFLWITKTGGAANVWKEDEQYIIKTKTRPHQIIRDLVFLSGYLAFDLFTWEYDWYRQFLEFQFDDLKWDKEYKVQVVPVVSLGTIINVRTKYSENVGWGVDYASYELKNGPNNTDIIRIKAALAVVGNDTHMNRVAYNVVAMGKLHQE